jgi:TRAP-type C4-dicarboxylate transport system substrate-binding protein
MNASQFNALSAEHQAIVQEEVDMACTSMSAASMASYEDGLEELRQNGMTIIDDVDRDAFAARAGAISEAFPEWSPGLYERARAIVTAE